MIAVIVCETDLCTCEVRDEGAASFLGGQSTEPAAKTPETVSPIIQDTVAFKLVKDDKLIVSIGQDGLITYGEGFTTDSASKEFWGAVSQEYLVACSQKKSKP